MLVSASPSEKVTGVEQEQEQIAPEKKLRRNLLLIRHCQSKFSGKAGDLNQIDPPEQGDERALDGRPVFGFAFRKAGLKCRD